MIPTAWLGQFWGAKAVYFSQAPKLYLLHNGVNVRIMAVTGARVTQEEFTRSTAKLREFFDRGSREAILEVKIRPEAVESIVKAMAELNAAPVPLATALSELLNFCRDAERAGLSETSTTLSELLWL
jgi:hypothetical protein